MEKGTQKLPPPSYFAWRAPEEIPLKFITSYVVIYLILHKKEWLECLSKIRCNKNEKNIVIAGPFKQTMLGLKGASSRGFYETFKYNT